MLSKVLPRYARFKRLCEDDRRKSSVRGECAPVNCYLSMKYACPELFKANNTQAHSLKLPTANSTGFVLSGNHRHNQRWSKHRDKQRARAKQCPGSVICCDQLEGKDRQLADDLRREFQQLSKRRAFGLNFERHVPESVELPGRPVRKGDKVRFLAARGEPVNSV